MVITEIQQVTGYDIGAFVAHRLQLYKNPDFTTAHLIALHRLPKSHHKNAQNQATEIRYCLIQAEEYFHSARDASLATRPVLLYYGIMSLALAEVLVKKTAASRLAKLREQHASHGLTLSVSGAIDPKADLGQICRNLAAKIQFRSTGQAYGTFDVWRSEVREAPVPAYVKTYHTGTRTFSTGPEVRFAGADTAPPVPPHGTYSLLEAVESIPQLRVLLLNIGIQPRTVRARLEEERQTDGNKTFTLIVHPDEQSVLDSFYERLVFSADSINTWTFDELPSGMLIRRQYSGNRFPENMALPPAICPSTSQVLFVTSGWSLGEFGSYYVALHILGNLARYYPDIWMQHVDRSTTFSMLVDQLCQIALARIPVLIAGEIDRRYYLAEA